MSLSSTATIKQQLTSYLGAKGPSYFDSLNNFITGRISRSEFDDALKIVIDAPHLVQLHNALIISLFDARSFKRPPSPSQDVPKPPPRKRRKTLPYQGPPLPGADMDGDEFRLKRWTVSMGKHERDRVKALKDAPAPPELKRPRKETDEIARERGIELLPERGDPAGSRPAVHLASATRAPTIQHVVDRMNLICAQHNLGTPARSVAFLMNLASEVKLKQLITHALTLTSSSLAISSISPSSASNSSLPHAQKHSQKLLTTAAFETLFTIAPEDLPNKSAAAMRLITGERELEDEEDRDVPLLKDREVRDQRWQIIALLGERSTVKEVLRGARS